MATTDLTLDEPGTLRRPGPIGRLVRLAFGVSCLYYVYGLWPRRSTTVRSDHYTRSISGTARRRNAAA